tara:strand:+ start:8450 stop:9274 length:825 start_codon:yes stop_codon:yes gene_type:complete
MPIHNFDFSPKNNDAGVQNELNPVVPVDQVGQPNLDRVNTESFDQETNIATEDVRDFVALADTMDMGVKKYFSDIVVPSKDGARSTKVPVRIAGGDKSILVWEQDLQSGRIKLPVISINRTGWRFNPERSTPAEAGHYFYRRFADKDGTRMIQSPREYPLLIDYALSIWGERKRDVEYIAWQIIPRFNPLARWVVEDEYMCGDIHASFEGATDSSDIDIDANQLAKVRYDINITIEGWIPLPGRITPTVLGRVTSLEDLDTRESFGAIKTSPRG